VILNWDCEGAVRYPTGRYARRQARDFLPVAQPVGRLDGSAATKSEESRGAGEREQGRRAPGAVNAKNDGGNSKPSCARVPKMKAAVQEMAPGVDPG
jgi:hypothetical protein